MGRAVDAFFSIGGKDEKTKDAVKGGVKGLVQTALSGFIGSTEVGESEKKVYMVIPENNALVRVDLACWKYHFAQQKFIDQRDTAVAYLLCKSVVDHTKLTIDELIYFASDAMPRHPSGGRTAITSLELMYPMAERTGEMDDEKFAKEIIEVITKTTGGKPVKSARGTSGGGGEDNTKGEGDETHNKSQRTDDRSLTEEDILSAAKTGRYWFGLTSNGTESGETLMTNKRFATIDGVGMETNRMAPPIQEVEAYIEELIRVWDKLRGALDKTPATAHT